MGRGKLSLKLIDDEKSRKTTFYKRKQSLMRKADELSILCDVPTCVFVCGPKQNDDSSSGEIYTWPTSRTAIDNMVSSYKANCIQNRSRKVVGLMDIFSERKKKIETEISKLRKETSETKYPNWDERLDYLSEDQLRSLMADLDSKIDAASERIDFMEKNQEAAKTTSKNPSQCQTLDMNIMQESFENQIPPIPIPIPSPQMIPFHHQIPRMNHQNLQMGNSIPMMPMDFHQYHHHHEMESRPQFLIGTNGSSQIQFNYGNFQTPIYNETSNYGMMEMNNLSLTSQNYSICHYGVPLPSPLSYMQFKAAADHQIQFASNPQMLLNNNNNNASAQANDQFEFINYEYLMKHNNKF